jgi:hypothetical protein
MSQALVKPLYIDALLKLSILNEMMEISLFEYKATVSGLGCSPSEMIILPSVSVVCF